MSDWFEAFKAKHPELNWKELEEYISDKDLEAAADHWDRLVANEKKGLNDAEVSEN